MILEVNQNLLLAPVRYIHMVAAMKILGQFDTLVESVDAFEVIEFHVVEGNCGSLLSYQNAKSLHIIDTINATTCNLKDSHAHLLRGIGTLKSEK